MAPTSTKSRWLVVRCLWNILGVALSYYNMITNASILQYARVRVPTTNLHLFEQHMLLFRGKVARLNPDHARRKSMLKLGTLKPTALEEPGGKADHEPLGHNLP